MRRTAQAIKRIIDTAESQKYVVEAEWEEGALWVQAWQHAWMRNALKWYKWMNQTPHHYKKNRVTVDYSKERGKTRGKKARR